jgi:hypothetical protein
VVEGPDGWVQVGVVSRGSNWFCAAPGNYSVFTGVHHYRSWIAHKMATGVEDKVIVNDMAEATAGDRAYPTVLSVALTLVEPEAKGALPTPLPPREPLVEQARLPLLGR